MTAAAACLIIVAQYRVKWSNTNVGLEHLALALGIPTPKEGIDGSQVFDFYKAGKQSEIADYCKRDVETTRAVYQADDVHSVGVSLLGR